MFIRYSSNSKAVKKITNVSCRIVVIYSTTKSESDRLYDGRYFLGNFYLLRKLLTVKQVSTSQKLGQKIWNSQTQ